jgi:hypothetical protein
MTVILVALFSTGVHAMASLHDGQAQFLASDAARDAARRGYMKQAWAFPPEYSRAMEHAKAGDPLLVERIDRKDSFYYIVPFERDGRATLLIIIDARTGDFKEAVPLKEPSHYPSITKERATKILTDFLQDPKAKEEINRVRPSLVWKPSEQSQSPYEPLWRFILEKGEWYIDQKGNVHQSIEEPRMKGGGVTH